MKVGRSEGLRLSGQKYLKTTMQMEGFEKKTTKSVPVSKQMVWESYCKVLSKGGGAGIDRESIDRFNEKRNDNLFKIWNRMASGSYFPPAVRTVFIQEAGRIKTIGHTNG